MSDRMTLERINAVLKEVPRGEPVITLTEKQFVDWHTVVDKYGVIAQRRALAVALRVPMPAPRLEWWM